MAKDSPSFTIPVSPEAEYLLDRYLEEYRQRALIDAAVHMSERVGDDGVTFDDMRKAIIYGPFQDTHRKHLTSVIRNEWYNKEGDKPNT